MSDFIDIQKEIQDLLSVYGREVFLRQKTNQKSSPFADDLESPTSSTLGFVYVDTKIIAYKRIPTEPTAGSYRTIPAGPGFMEVDEALFYFTTTSVFPSVHDWVLEVRNNDTTGKMSQPYDIQRAWDVNQVVDIRDNYGKLAYYMIRSRRVELGK